MLTHWLGSRGVAVPQRELFSDLGFVVDECAIGFLFKTESKQAYIDHIAADPDSDTAARSEALDTLFLELEKKARELGYLMVTVLASLPVMKRRFLTHGYEAHGEYTLFYKYIGGEKCLG